MQQPSHCFSLPPTAGGVVEAALNTYLKGAATCTLGSREQLAVGSWPSQSLRTRCWREDVRGWQGVGWD